MTWGFTDRTYEKIEAQHGVLQDTDVKALATNEYTRLLTCLVRCGGGRFYAPAQDVEHFIELLERGGDYVRDVQLGESTTIGT